MAALAGKAALVTGAASGIGKAAAIALAAEGAKVAAADIEVLDDTLAAIKAIRSATPQGDAIDIRGDVADEGDAIRMAKETAAEFGSLDILVNNAGIILEKPLLETTTEDFERLMAINLRGVFLVGREAIRVMVDQGKGGRVINTASELAYLGRAESSVYCASKGGILSLTRSWAREFAPDILVNAVAPGPVDTPMLAPENMSPELREKESDIPLQRVGKPEEIASVIVFLAGPGATFVTGQTFGPNGGAVMP